ncbi:MAG: hypothetical protein ACLGI6_04200 [Gammaproteobacteria bacterium]
MLKLSEAQLAELAHLETLQFLAEVRKKIVTEFPEYADDRNLDTRLEQAHRHALTLGFQDGPSITQFLYYEAFAPGFYRQAAINAWLTKPGYPVEQRLADLVAQMTSTLKGY